MNSRATFESSHAGRIGAYAAGADGMSRSKSAPAPAAVILDPRAKLYLLLLSEELPALPGLSAQFGTGAAPETRRYEPLLDRVTPGSCWLFLLTANPTRTRKDPADPLARGALKPCYLEAEQEQWLLEQAGKHGFALTEGAFQVTRKQTCHFRKNGKRPVTLLAVTYEGILQVTDPEAFREMLWQGIGRGKAYGLGLMTILHGESSHG